MENEYKDFVIMSPELMEDIAKKYQEQLNKKNTLKEFAYKNKICRLLEEIANLIETLKIVCSRKFYYTYKNALDDNFKIFSNLHSYFSDDKLEIKKKYKTNFCTTLKTMLIKLCELIEICLTAIKEEKDSKLNECIFTCLFLIKQTTNYFGDCRYRKF